MTNKSVLKKLKKDYLDYVLTWVDAKKLAAVKVEFCVSKIMADIISALVFRKSGQPDFKVKWDADGDRVFFKDEKGRKIPAYFITALLAKIIQGKYPKAKIVHDSRLIWAIQDSVKNTYYERERVKRFSSGARGSYICKAGWPNFLNFMHKNKILFGGEASGHYYFASFASKKRFSSRARGSYFNRDLVLNDGIIPILLIAEQNKSLSELIRPYRAKYFISGEMNFKKKIDLKKLAREYQNAKISHLDGLSVEYPNYRFNLRQSQTENLWRLNIEARDKNLLQEKKKELYEKLQA